MFFQSLLFSFFYQIRVVSTRKAGHIQCELDISEEHLNRNGN